MFVRLRSVPADKLPIIGIGIGMLIIALLSYASLFTIATLQTNAAWVEHTHQVRFELEQTAFAASDAQAAVRGYVISNKTDFLAPFDAASRKLPGLLTTLRSQLSDNPAQEEKMSQLSASMDSFLAQMLRTVQLRQSVQESERAIALVTEGAGDRALANIRTQISVLQNTEASLLAQRKHQIGKSSGETRLLLITGTCFAFLMLGGTFWLLSREIRQRQRSDDALNKSNLALLQHASQLEQANQELESFSYSVSHDLRIPLRAVSGYASMLAEDYESILDEEGKRLLNVIRNNGKQMGVLIDDLLAFSKLGRQTLSATEIDMQVLAENVLVEARDRASAYPAIVVINRLPPGWGDRALLRQVWTNLISNALKYSSKNLQAAVIISGEENEVESTYSVSDNGVGFDMAYYEKLFGVFQRLHAADEFPGTGVGLAIVHRIITRHGGRIWAESEIGKGTTFYFALPNKELS
jgi:signal transduction histidine kinase